MHPLETNPTAIQIIARSMTCHPSMLIESLENSAKQDLAYKAGKSGVIESAIANRWNATKLAVAIARNGKAEDFKNCISPGIIALNIACKLQCLPAHIRTAAAVKTWGQE